MRKLASFRTALVAGMVLAGALALAACGGNGEEEPQATAPDQQEEAAPAGDHVAMEGGEVLVHVETKDFKFDPDVIVLKAGQTVRLALDNSDAVLHDLTTDDAQFVIVSEEGTEHMEHADDAVDAGEEDDGGGLEHLHVAAEANDHGELVFQAAEPGEYRFYCSVPGHVAAGMVGTIVVEP